MDQLELEDCQCRLTQAAVRRLQRPVPSARMCPSFASDCHRDKHTVTVTLPVLHGDTPAQSTFKCVRIQGHACDGRLGWTLFVCRGEPACSAFAKTGAEGQKASGDVWSQAAISDPTLDSTGKTDCQRTQTQPHPYAHTHAHTQGHGLRSPETATISRWGALAFGIRV